MAIAPVIRTVIDDVEPSRIRGDVAAFTHLAPDWRPIGDRDPDIDLPSEARVATARDAGVRLATVVGAAGTAMIGLIVDATPPGAGRDPVRLADIATATGVPIVACTGAHAPPARLPRIEERSAEYLAEWFAFEVTSGIAAVVGDRLRGIPILSERAAGRAGDLLNDVPVRAGAIRITMATPMLDRGDRNLLDGAAIASGATGVATFLDAPAGTDLGAIADRFEASGGNRARLALAPGARTPDEVVAAAALGLRVVVRAPLTPGEGAIAIWSATIRGLARLGLADHAVATRDVTEADGHPPVSLEFPGIDSLNLRAVTAGNALQLLALAA